MTPIEFALWLNGAVGVMGDEPPTPEQWARIQEKLSGCVGQLVAARLLEEAEDVCKRKAEEEKRKAYQVQLDAMRAQAQAQMSKMLARNIDTLAFKSMAGISAPFAGGIVTLAPTTTTTLTLD